MVVCSFLPTQLYSILPLLISAFPLSFPFLVMTHPKRFLPAILWSLTLPSFGLELFILQHYSSYSLPCFSSWSTNNMKLSVLSGLLIWEAVSNGRSDSFYFVVVSIKRVSNNLTITLAISFHIIFDQEYWRR